MDKGALMTTWPNFKAVILAGFLAGANRREYVLPEDVKALALDIFRHRLILDIRAEGDGTTTEDVVQQILDKVEIP